VSQSAAFSNSSFERLFRASCGVEWGSSSPFERLCDTKQGSSCPCGTKRRLEQPPCGPVWAPYGSQKGSSVWPRNIMGQMGPIWSHVGRSRSMWAHIRSIRSPHRPTRGLLEPSLGATGAARALLGVTETLEGAAWAPLYATGCSKEALKWAVRKSRALWHCTLRHLTLLHLCSVHGYARVHTGICIIYRHTMFPYKVVGYPLPHLPPPPPSPYLVRFSTVVLLECTHMHTLSARNL
jgi:hypothetical protein